MTKIGLIKIVTDLVTSRYFAGYWCIVTDFVTDSVTNSVTDFKNIFKIFLNIIFINKKIILTSIIPIIIYLIFNYNFITW